MRRLMLLPGLLVLPVPLAAAPPVNPQIDYPGFQALGDQVRTIAKAPPARLEDILGAR